MSRIKPQFILCFSIFLLSVAIGGEVIRSESEQEALNKLEIQIESTSDPTAYALSLAKFIKSDSEEIRNLPQSIVFVGPLRTISLHCPGALVGVIIVVVFVLNKESHLH